MRRQGITGRSVFVLAVLALAGWAHAARAETVTQVYADGTQPPTLVTSTTSSVIDLVLVAPGRLSITLTDLQFPALFSALSFSLTTASQTLQTFALNGASSGSWYYDVAAPMTLSGILYARPNAAAGAGMYNLDVRYTYDVVAPVPLPATMPLLTLALAGLAVIGRSAVKRSVHV